MVHISSDILRNFLSAHYDQPASFKDAHFEEKAEHTIKREDDKDPIDLDPLTNPVITKCGHIFSRATLVEWLETAPHCPLDRTPLRPSDIKSIRKLIIEEKKPPVEVTIPKVEEPQKTVAAIPAGNLSSPEQRATGVSSIGSGSTGYDSAGIAAVVDESVGKRKELEQKLQKEREALEVARKVQKQKKEKLGRLKRKRRKKRARLKQKIENLKQEKNNHKKQIELLQKALKV